MKRNVYFFGIMVMALSLAAAEVNILDTGAQPGSLCTTEIQQAIDRCAAQGGGVVRVPAGVYTVGTLELKSNINLHLEQGAVLQGSYNLDDYAESFRRHGIIYCMDAENVSITGLGTIDARGTHFYDPTQNHTYEEFDKSATRQKENYMPEGEFYSDGPIKRKPKPGMTVTFYHCSNIQLQDVTIKDTPSWAVRFAYCDDVRVSGISIKNNLLVPNSDGVHCTASRNIRITDCDIRAGDDAIIVTGFAIDEETPGFTGEEQAARTFGNKTDYAENVVVANCHLQSRSSGIRVGYGQHPIRRCVFSNIQIYGSNRGIGIFAHDAADIEELIFSDIVIQTRLHNGQWWGNGEPIHISAISRFENLQAGAVRDVQFNNIIATSEHGILLYGRDKSRLENIRLDNVQIELVKGRETLTYGGNFDLRPAADISKQIFEHDIPALYAQYVDRLVVDDFKVSWGKGLPDFFTHAVQTQNVTDLRLQHLDGTANPNCEDCEAIKLSETTQSE